MLPPWLIRLKLYGAYCAVWCWNCAAEGISLVLEQPPRGVCLLLRKGNPPLVQLDLKCPPTSSGNETAVITSDEIMYNPFDRLLYRRACKNARWVVLSHVVAMSQVAHTCAWLLGCLAQSWGGAHQFRVPSASSYVGYTVPEGQMPPLRLPAIGQKSLQMRR